MPLHIMYGIVGDPFIDLGVQYFVPKISLIANKYNLPYFKGEITRIL